MSFLRGLPSLLLFCFLSLMMGLRNSPSNNGIEQTNGEPCSMAPVAAHRGFLAQRTERHGRGWREIALASVLLTATGMSSRAPSMRETTSAEEYAIYAVLLAESEWVRGRAAVVQMETADDVSRSADDFEKIAEILKQKFVDKSSLAPLPDELIESFTRLRSKEAQVDAKGFRKTKVVVLPSDTIRKIFEGAKSWEGWELLRERYDAGSIFRFSRVAFSADRDRAMVAVSERCGLLCGIGEYVLLAKVDGQWSVIAKQLVWIS